MDKVISTYETRLDLFKRMVLLVAFLFMLVPFGNSVIINHADGNVTEPTTTETQQTGGDLSNIGVTMGNDGSLTISGISDSDGTSTWNRIYVEYKEIIVGIAGIATLTFFVFFIINLLKLGGSGDNPNARRSAIIGLIFTFIGCAGCGSVTLFVALAWNALK